jgi:Ohr subfamily peroxiredoxin
MTQSHKVLHTAKTYTTGNRANGSSRSSDGRLDISFTNPGSAGTGTSPEQLLAAGWSACFMGAMGLAAAKLKVPTPASLAIGAEVDLCVVDGSYFLQARLDIHAPGMERELVQSLVEAAHQTCPYSKATHGNIDVSLNVV